MLHVSKSPDRASRWTFARICNGSAALEFVAHLSGFHDVILRSCEHGLR